MARATFAAVSCVLAGVRSAVAFQPAAGVTTAVAGRSRCRGTWCGAEAPTGPLLAVSPAGNSGTSTQWAALSAVFLGSAVVAARRRRAGRAAPVARRITAEQIEALTIEDLPAGFRPKISLGMARRYELKEAIKKTLGNTFFFFAFNKDGLACNQLEEARSMFPPTVTVRALKNSLVRKAMEGTPWETFAPELRGSNMFVFVHEDVDLKPAIETYLKIEKKFGRVAKVAEFAEKFGYEFELRSLRGGILVDEFNFIEPKDVPKFKDFPTRLELIARIAGGVKQVTQKIAVGINMVPKKLAVGTKKIVEKMEDEGKATVADVVA